MEALDDARVRLTERVLRGGLGAEARHQHRAKQRGPVLAQELAERAAIARMSALAELSLRLQIRPRYRHGPHDSRTLSSWHDRR